MSLRGSTVQTRRRIMVRSAYTSSNLGYTDDNLVVIDANQREGTPEEHITLDEFLTRFESMPSVRAYGIDFVHICDRETNEILEVIRTRWDDLREERRRIRREQIERQIERLQNELSSLT